MSMTGLRQFDETVHLSNTWLKGVMDRLEWTERADAYRAMRATLHTLRDHLPMEAAAHLAAQLPMLLRGVYYEGWRPSAQTPADRSEEAFLEPIARAFDRDIFTKPGRVAHACWQVIESHISPGESQQVLHHLPKAARRILTAD